MPYQYQRYQLAYIMNGDWHVYNAWHVCAPSQMPEDVQNSINRLLNRMPNATYRVEWHNPDTGRYEVIADSSSKSKYSLFSED